MSDFIASGVPKFNLLEIKWGSDKSSPCVVEKCHTTISQGDDCFIDLSKKDVVEVLCHQCGVCERYHRKKESERSEKPQNF